MQHLIVVELLGDPEVTEFDHSLFVNQEVLQLDISMHNSLFVAVFDRHCYLLEDVLGKVFTKFHTASGVGKKVSPCA